MEKRDTITEIFGANVFNDEAMQVYLPKAVFKKLKKTIEDGLELDNDIADSVAHGMKEWAIDRGATHYTHWFQPLTGVTAEKHDSFISAPKNGKVIMEYRMGLYFSGIFKEGFTGCYLIYTYSVLFI